MSVITDTTVQVRHQKAMGSKTMERRVSNVILNVYQSTGIEKKRAQGSLWRAMGSLMKYEGSTTKYEVSTGGE